MSGLSAMQMRHAPYRSLYVWVSHNSLRYAKELARHLGRSDLHILAASQLDYRIYGLTFGGLVIDHALAGKLNANQREVLDRLRAYIRPTTMEVASAT
jgi:hypothetical protein